MSETPTPPFAAPTMTLPEALQRANAHWQAGQAAQAEQLCQRILASLPGQPDALHLLGLMSHAYGHTDRAIQYLREACVSPTAAPIYWSNLAEMCRQQGRLREGEEAARKAVTLDSTLSGAWNNLGILLQEMGQYDESRICLEKVHAGDPQNPRVLNNLANTCLRQGDGETAERYWQEAIACDPGYPQPYSNLAKRLTDRGEYVQALEYGRQAITRDPHLTEAYINLAAAEQERGDTVAALRWLNALLSFAPLHAGGLATRAHLLLKQERLEEALSAAQKAVTQAPESADAHYALGLVQQALNQGEAALAAFEQAADLPGTKAEDAAIAAAVLHMEQGRKAEADAAFLEIAERFPQSVSAWYNWADIHRFRPEDPQIARMEALLADPARLPKEQMRLHFALGKAWLDAGDPEKAFAHFAMGNRQKRETFQYDPEETTRWTRNICQTLTHERIQALWNQGYSQTEDQPGRPIFVVGMPRSGTTLVERILAAHSAVTGAGELSALQQVLATAHYPESLQTASAETLRALGKAYLEKTGKLNPKTRYLVDKMPANFFYAGLIPLILPQAKIIWVRRDPVDTGLSCYTKLFSGEQSFSYQLDEMGHFARNAQTLLEHWQQVIPASHFMVVDYEAIVEDFDTQVRRMLEFLGLDWEDTCADFHNTPGNVRTASVNQVREPLYRRAVGRWKPYAEYLQPLLQALEQNHAVDAD